MATFVTVAELADLDPGSCVSVEVNGRWVALFNVEGRVYAMDNTCPHAGGPLGEGTLTGDIDRDATSGIQVCEICRPLRCSPTSCARPWQSA